MPRISLSTPGGERSWKDGEKILGIFRGTDTTEVKGDDVDFLIFQTADGTVTRWVTGRWAKLLEEKKLKSGMVLDIKAESEVKVKGGRRFRPFTIDLLTGPEIPKSLKKLG